MTDTRLTPYGLLLSFDGYGADPALCASEEALLSVLRTLPDEISMRRLGEPHTVYVDEEGIRGRSGFTFIMESHISIHTYEERGFITADVYSCKPFDIEYAVTHLVEAFGITSFEKQVLTRGRDFNRVPHSPPVRPHVRL